MNLKLKSFAGHKNETKIDRMRRMSQAKIEKVFSIASVNSSGSDLVYVFTFIVGVPGLGLVRVS